MVKALDFVKTAHLQSPAPGGRGAAIIGRARSLRGYEMPFVILVGAQTYEIRHAAKPILPPSPYGVVGENWELYAQINRDGPSARFLAQVSMGSTIEIGLRRLTPDSYFWDGS